MLKKLRQVLLTVLPTVIYAHIDYDNEQKADPPLIVYQEDGTYTDEIYHIYGMDKETDGERL